MAPAFSATPSAISSTPLCPQICDPVDSAPSCHAGLARRFQAPHVAEKRWFSGFAHPNPDGGVFQAAEPIAHAPSDAPTAACRSPCDTGSGHRLGAQCGPIGAFLGGGELERPGHRFPLEQPGVRNRSGARKDYRASFATASRYEGRNDSTAAQNLGPCPGTSRWHISWTTTYSRHSGG